METGDNMVTLVKATVVSPCWTNSVSPPKIGFIFTTSKWCHGTNVKQIKINGLYYSKAGNAYPLFIVNYLAVKPHHCPRDSGQQATEYICRQYLQLHTQYELVIQVT